MRDEPRWELRRDGGGPIRISDGEFYALLAAVLVMEYNTRGYQDPSIDPIRTLAPALRDFHVRLAAGDPEYRASMEKYISAFDPTQVN